MYEYDLGNYDKATECLESIQEHAKQGWRVHQYTTSSIVYHDSWGNEQISNGYSVLYEREQQQEENTPK